jgi:hypothetical protein
VFLTVAISSWWAVFWCGTKSYGNGTLIVSSSRAYTCQRFTFGKSVCRANVRCFSGMLEIWSTVDSNPSCTMYFHERNVKLGNQGWLQSCMGSVIRSMSRGCLQKRVELWPTKDDQWECSILDRFLLKNNEDAGQDRRRYSSLNASANTTRPHAFLYWAGLFSSFRSFVTRSLPIDSCLASFCRRRDFLGNEPSSFARM